MMIIFLQYPIFLWLNKKFANLLAGSRGLKSDPWAGIGISREGMNY